jgi:hypothetical protein
VLDPIADLDQIFANDFSVAATHNGVTVRGILDTPSRDISTGGEVGVIGVVNTFTCQTSGVSSAIEGETMTISGVTYVLREVLHDGTGVTELVLEEQ